MLAQVRPRIVVSHFRTEERDMRISMSAKDLKKIDTKVPSVQSSTKRIAGQFTRQSVAFG